VDVSDAQHGGNTPTRSERFHMACWRMSFASNPTKHTDFVWRHAVRRCFSTCSDSTHAITAEELKGERGLTARRASQAAWSWGANSEGVKFSMSQGTGLLITPWGHGSWGLTSRGDVLFAEFAQQNHMLRFIDSDPPRYVSTRCSDGDLLSGKALRSSADDGGPLRQGWWQQG